VFASGHTGWLSAWPEIKTIALQTKASAQSNGSLYFLNLDSGQQKKILSGINALTTLVSPDAKLILYSSGATPKLSILDLAGKHTADVAFKTFPEKCTWAGKKYFVYCAVPAILPASAYPDDWYAGVVSFNDSIWSYNIETGETKVLYDATASTLSEQIDAINLVLSKDEKILYFINKRDNSLWSFDLEDTSFPSN
jgi:hypothetical protein